MTVKKDPKRQLLGKIAKARGKQFESRIDDSFAYYAQKGFAIIEKTPEPMHPTKNLGNGKFIAYYEKQAQPDYKGTIKGGRTVMFEAKFTAADRMEQSRVLQSQQDYTVMNINTISQFTQTVKPAGLRKEGGAPCLKLLMSLPGKQR